MPNLISKHLRQHKLTLSRLIKSLTFLLLVAITLIGCQTRQQQSCLQIAQQTAYSPNTLQLSHYQIAINKKTIDGIDNLSALTWNEDTQTLFGTLNKPATIVELSTQGELLRKITLNSIIDPEAIEYIGNNQFIVADERFHRLIKVTLNEQTNSINSQDNLQLTLEKSYQYNKGLEGLAYDHQRKIIYVSNESNPITIYKITGWIEGDVIHITEIKKDWSSFLTDISGLHFHAPDQTLLVLSDESKLILALNNNDQIVGCFPLTNGQHGLWHTLRQPEGITMDNKGNLYIVSEPNFFYKYIQK